MPRFTIGSILVSTDKVDHLNLILTTYPLFQSEGREPFIRTSPQTSQWSFMNSNAYHVLDDAFRKKPDQLHYIKKDMLPLIKEQLIKHNMQKVTAYWYTFDQP